MEIVYDFSMTRAARATKIACDNRKQKSYRVNRPLAKLQVFAVNVCTNLASKPMSKFLSAHVINGHVIIFGGNLARQVLSGGGVGEGRVRCGCFL